MLKVIEAKDKAQEMEIQKSKIPANKRGKNGLWENGFSITGRIDSIPNHFQK